LQEMFSSQYNEDFKDELYTVSDIKKALSRK
jgi:hypothetical protein